MPFSPRSDKKTQTMCDPGLDIATVTGMLGARARRLVLNLGVGFQGRNTNLFLTVRLMPCAVHGGQAVHMSLTVNPEQAPPCGRDVEWVDSQAASLIPFAHGRSIDKNR